MKKQVRDFTKLFRSEVDGFISELDLKQSEKDIILRVTQEVRDTLRAGLSAFGKRKGIPVDPRFMSQGSAVYKTRNRQPHSPPQRIDHDYGCYLPFSYLESNDSPKIAAEEFFAEVDLLLEQLVKQKAYKGVIKKKTCSRLVVNDNIHIDVPLYSIPDSELRTINEAVSKMGYLFDSIEFGEQYFDLDYAWPIQASEHVLLAHRTDGWQKSDPRKFNLHFSRLLKADELLRRICRYVKAFRDEKWIEGGPCSIALMILASDARAMSSPKTQVEQDALLFVLQKIPDLLRTEIENPTDRAEKISVSNEDKVLLARLCNDFARDLERAINDGNISDTAACDLIRSHLGARFPRRTEVPKKDGFEEMEDESWRTVAIKRMAETATVRPKPYYRG